MTHLPTECEVAIVGAGPTGLATALLLQKLGVDALILEAREHPQQTARATFIHSRTLEVLEDVDATDDLVNQINPIKELSLCIPQQTLLKLDFGSLKAKYNYAAILPQTDTEKLLIDKYEVRGGRIFRGIKVASTKQSDGASHVLLALQDTRGESHSLRAKYVVAADGLHSPIRESYSIPFEGAHYNNLLLLTAELRLKITDEELLQPSKVKLFMTSKGIALWVPQPSGLWRIYTTMHSTPKDEDVDKSFYQTVADESVGKGVGVQEMLWTAHFHIAHRLAKRYRAGRVLLAGDAAHCHSPAGGQGMNTGIQDGMTLAKILADALKIETEEGGNADACLDQYEAQRRPVAEGVIALTDRLTVHATLQNPILAWLRNLVLRVISQSSWALGHLTRRMAQYPQLEA